MIDPMVWMHAAIASMTDSGDVSELEMVWNRVTSDVDDTLTLTVRREVRHFVTVAQQVDGKLEVELADDEGDSEE